MIVFNGETFPTVKAWATAYPAYGKNYAALVKAGADTTMKLEQAIHAKHAAARKASLRGTLNSPFNNSEKASKA